LLATAAPFAFVEVTIHDHSVTNLNEKSSNPFFFHINGIVEEFGVF
jgi:hypothetical protein